MKRGRALYKRITLAVLCLLMTGLCACNSGSNSSSSAPQGSEESLGVYINEDGRIVYTFGDPDEEPADTGAVLHRDPNEPKEVPEGSISHEEAKKVLDSCSFEELYLPCSVSGLSAKYEGIEEIGTKKYLKYSFYAEKNGTRIFLGTNACVSPDGKTVYKKNWASKYDPVETGSSRNDKTQSELYPEASVSPEEAIFVLAGADLKALGLTEALTDYTFETDSRLHTIKSLPCYKITPKLYMTAGMEMKSPVYITADGSGHIMIPDNSTGEYSVVS